jgi:hypothetical protein
MAYDKSVLENKLKELYKDNNKKPGCAKFCEMFKGIIGEDKLEDDGPAYFNHANFAWDLMELVGKTSNKKFHEKIKPAKGAINKMAAKIGEVAKKEVKFTLRHYTSFTGSQPMIRCTAQLEAMNIHKSKNTNDKDWYEIGNVGYTFYLLCVGGVAPNRTFLSGMKRYAEFDMAGLDKVFVSGDMLGAGANKPGGFIGTGAEVRDALLSLQVDKSSPEAFLSALDTYFGNTEAKIPGKVDVARWINV